VTDHGPSAETETADIPDGYCQCQCGQRTAPGKRFVRGHQLRIRANRQRTSCSSHCPTCNTCFTGTASFDAHLVRSAVGLNDLGAPTYELVHLTAEEAGLEAAVTGGVCTLATPELQNVTVWRIPLEQGEDQPSDDQPVEPIKPPPLQVSPDGYYGWDGFSWRPMTDWTAT
jgi:hypothetical protein